MSSQIQANANGVVQQSLLDRALLNRLRKDTTASAVLGELLETFRTYLLLIGERETGKELRAKVAPSDLVQETMLAAHRDFASFRGRSSQEFAAWLRAIFLHKLAESIRFHTKTGCRNLFREQREMPGSSITPLAEQLVDKQTPSWHAMRNEDLLMVRAALLQLPDRYRRVIRLRNFELYPFKDVGRQLGCSPDAARALWGRAMQCLKEVLDERAVVR